MSLLFGGSRDELRRGWLQAWQQARAGAVLTPLETQLAGKLRLEWREYGTRTGLLPGLQPAAAQFVTRATEQQTHESARVLWRKAQRSAMPHAGQAGLRALHT